MKILIADDSVEIRRCIREMLSPDHQIIEAGSGREAVAAFHSDRPDWVLMDIEMPDQDGLSAAREIRAAAPQARIVFVTGHEGRRFDFTNSVGPGINTQFYQTIQAPINLPGLLVR